MRKRSRTRSPILSRISDRSPPVCRCRITAVTKNRRSRLGTRSHIDRRLSSMATPRFCSSNTRPNSLPIGALISAATALKPKARLCPDRRMRAIISRASGSCMLKAFSRFFRRQRSQNMGSEPAAIAGQRDHGHGALHGHRHGTAGQPQDHRSHGQLAHRERGVGLLEEQVEVAELLEPLGQHVRRVVQRPGQDAVVLEQSSLPDGEATPVRTSSRSSSREVCGWAKSITAPPTRVATPTKARMPMSRGFMSSPPT